MQVALTLATPPLSANADKSALLELLARIRVPGARDSRWVGALGKALDVLLRKAQATSSPLVDAIVETLATFTEERQGLVAIYRAADWALGRSPVPPLHTLLSTLHAGDCHALEIALLVLEKAPTNSAASVALQVLAARATQADRRKLESLAEWIETAKDVPLVVRRQLAKKLREDVLAQLKPAANG